MTLVERISQLKPWQGYGLSFLCGVFSVLALAPFFLWPILLLTFPLFLIQLDILSARPSIEIKQRKFLFFFPRRPAMRRAAWHGWWFGFGYFLAGLYWIGAAFLVEAEKFIWLLPFAVSLLPAGLALFYAAATAAAYMFWSTKSSRLIVVALSFALFEWLRGHIFTGFPWNALGYGLTGSDLLMQWASIFGIYGLSFFAVLFFSAPLVLLSSHKDGPKLAGKLLALGLIGLLALVGLIGGQYRISQIADASSPAPNQAKPSAPAAKPVRLRLVQPNIPQTEKWKPQNQNWIFQRFMDLSSRDAAYQRKSLETTDILIWPEVALPFFLSQSSYAQEKIAELLPKGTILLYGGLRLGAANAPDQRQKVFNSLFALGHQAQVLQYYDKKHLVPFGEYLPLQTWAERLGLEQLTRLRGGFAVGQGPRYVKLGALPAFAPLICYEVIFAGNITPAFTRGESQKRPKWLLNVTNDGWFGTSSGPYQHLHQARVRAVEEGLPLIRAANTGVSAIIDSFGRVKAFLPLNRSGVIEATLPPALELTFYARYNDYILAVIAFFIVFLLFFLDFLNKRKIKRRERYKMI